MQISKECNGKSRVEYEMFNKQWVINEIFNEKAKKSSTFLELRSEILFAKCLNQSNSAYKEPCVLSYETRYVTLF